jgi:4,5-dihydroxyphthalate decarboxylase
MGKEIPNMAELKLSFAMTPYDRVLPLINGEVKLDGITLEYMGAPGGVSRIFYEQIKFQRYDLSEMSMSSFLRMRSIGWPYRILPVFHNRNFSYTYIHIRRSASIRQDHPEDLKGKRIGIGDYQQSLGLWTRGILQMEFGVKPEDMVWYQERGEHFSHTGASMEAGLAFPSGVTLHYAENDFGTMFLRGELDANTGLGIRLAGVRGRGFSSGLDRIHITSSENPDIIPLFSDPRQEAIRFFKKTGVYPPHHTTVIRESIVEEYPWVAISLMEAFQESKRIAIERLRQSPPTLLVFGQLYLKELDEIFGLDPFPYGIKANAKAFDMAQTFSVQQKLTERKQPLNEIFPQEVIYQEERLP